MGAGGCVEVVEVDVELAGGSDVVVPDALCEEPAFPLIRTAVAIPAPARTRHRRGNNQQAERRERHVPASR